MTELDSYGLAYTMLLLVLLVLIGLTEQKLSVTQQRSRRFQLAGAQAILSYLLILDAQLIGGVLQYLSDGVLRVGFPEDFYAASVWWSAPIFDRFALLADLVVVSVAATLYACARISPNHPTMFERDNR